jgi:hypothetical protein
MQQLHTATHTLAAYKWLAFSWAFGHVRKYVPPCVLSNTPYLAVITVLHASPGQRTMHVKGRYVRTDGEMHVRVMHAVISGVVTDVKSCVVVRVHTPMHAWKLVWPMLQPGPGMKKRAQSNRWSPTASQGWWQSAGLRSWVGVGSNSN